MSKNFAVVFWTVLATIAAFGGVMCAFGNSLGLLIFNCFCFLVDCLFLHEAINRE